MGIAKVLPSNLDKNWIFVKLCEKDHQFCQSCGEWHYSAIFVVTISLNTPQEILISQTKFRNFDACRDNLFYVDGILFSNIQCK